MDGDVGKRESPVAELVDDEGQQEQFLATDFVASNFHEQTLSQGQSKIPP
ncbi:hypothetical protein O9992_13205 [Vibrio lentus]|nr:hypothetical protein [Vibrio lentus]